MSDDASALVLQLLNKFGVRFLALRSAGFNHVDVAEAKKLNIKVARVAEYSPYSVAEHSVALMLALNRKLIRAHNRVMEQNFSLDGLVGFDLHGKTIGVIGTGKIGLIFARIMAGFGCQILGYDLHSNPEFIEIPNTRYVDLPELFSNSDIISLHCPLTPETRYLVNTSAINQMKPGVFLINTSRGGLIDTQAVIGGLKSRIIGALGLDVYEQEAELFFEDLSNQIIQDDIFERLLTFPNVIVTGHQAFFTADALEAIAKTTIASINSFATGQPLENEISPNS